MEHYINKWDLLQSVFFFLIILQNIQQIALGHAHTLVLCKQDNNTQNVLYVFGSNHYGQLGLGQEDRFNVTIDTRNGKSFVLSLIPRRLNFCEEITLINTKLFVNVGGFFLDVKIIF